MKRKVLKAGRSSLAVSLPKEFVDRNGLESGQEIDVNQYGSSLTIKCERPSPSEKELNLEDLKTRKNLSKITDKIIGALFRKGLDSFTITCKEEKNAEAIRDIIRKGKLNLYEEPSMTNDNKVEIHCSMTHFNEKSLENMINVVIKQVYRNFSDFINALENDSLTGKKAKQLAERDHTINEQTDICKRIINRNVTDFKSTSSFSFVDKLEKMGDEVKYITAYTAQADRDKAMKYSELMNRVKEFFFMLYSSNTGFTIKKLNAFNDEYYDMKKEMEKCEDKKLYYHLFNIVKMIRDSYSDLMVKHL